MGQRESKVGSSTSAYDIDERHVDILLSTLIAAGSINWLKIDSGTVDKIRHSTGASKTYFICKDLPESIVNIYLCISKPKPSANLKGVALPSHLEQWLVSEVAASSSAPGHHHFLLDASRTSNKRISKAANDVISWQTAMLGSWDSKFWDVWPSDFSPEELLELKLAIERGDSSNPTLLDLIRIDLDKDSIKEELFRRLDLAAKELLKKNGTAYAMTLVCTDVDDTWVSSIFDRSRYERGTVYPGYKELLEAQGDFLTILTARPALMAAGTRGRALERLNLPTDKPERTNISVSPGHVIEAVDSVAMGMRKMDTLMLQSRLFPEVRLVFNGDSGQGDWIAALIVRDLAPNNLHYATIHNVRNWSRLHRNQVRGLILTNEVLLRVLKRKLSKDLNLPFGEPLNETNDRKLDAMLQELLNQVDKAFDGPRGQLNKDFLRSKNIYLFRNHAELALDLYVDGHIKKEAALKVVHAAAQNVKFYSDEDGEADIGFDDSTCPQVLIDKLEKVFQQGK